MAKLNKFREKTLTQRAVNNRRDVQQQNPNANSVTAVLPLGAMLLAGSFSMPGFAQDATETVLKPVVVRDQREQEGKDSIKVNRSTTAKGNQALRDIPQSVTVVTEKLIDDRNLDTLKDVLRNAAGVTFQAAEGGEEDIRLRGFSLATTGDIFLDGMRDPAFYERDTFNLDRVDVLRGSASMLFGRGSTGGLANQVTKRAHTMNDQEVSATLGSSGYRRLTGDFNLGLGQSSALRVNAMHTVADNDGKGNGVDKRGAALNFRTGIGERNEFEIGLSHLDNENPRMNYGLPWIRPTATATQGSNTLWTGVRADAYYGMASDRNAGTANIFTASHKYRFDTDSEIKTQFRRGIYTRDQRASAIRFATGQTVALDTLNAATRLSRGTNLKVQDMQVSQLQSDFNRKFKIAGLTHEIMTGLDLAREEKQVYAAISALQGGAVPSKANTTVGTPADGAFADESLRSFRTNNDFASRSASVYLQDMVHLTGKFKVVAGLRYDKMTGKYSTYAVPNNALTPVTTTNYQQKLSELSKRIGVLYQPSALTSLHFSYGTSFNTSGDTYSYNTTSANTPPERSRNIEIGAKLDSANKNWTTRYALFYSEKYNERNTDADTAATNLLLSGKRHAAGLEFDVSGRITPAWELFGSSAWIPDAKIDRAAACPATGQCLQSAGGARVGDRPGLTPKFSGTLWNTYQVNREWRIGAGVNWRSRQAPADIGNPAAGTYNAPGFATVDLLAEYRFNERYTIKLSVNNVADKYYADTLYRGHYVPGQGRYAYLTMSARF